MRMSHPYDFPMSHPQDFSNLEVTSLQDSTTLQNFTGGRPDEGFKEVTQLPGRLFLAHPSNGSSRQSSLSGPSPLSHLSPFNFQRRTAESSPSRTQSPVLSFSNLFVESGPTKYSKPMQVRRCGIPLKAFWILIAVLLALVALAVGVAVGLIVYKRETAAALSVGNYKSNGTSTSSPRASSIATATPTIAPNARLTDRSGLASVAWNDTVGATQYRVYYQNDDRTIQESAWNRTSNAWTKTQIIGQAKDKSPIAAAVTGPQDFAFELSVYAIADNGTIVEWTSRDNSHFATGNMTDQNVQPADVSSLTVLWDRHHGCPQCTNSLLFAYQRGDGHLLLGNCTSGAWQWTTLISDPAPGTDLALALHWHTTVSGDIRLYYQTLDGNLVSQDYNGPRGPSPYTWISRESEPMSQLGSISPLATFSYGTTPAGDTLYNDVITANSSGLAVTWWDGIYDIKPPEQQPKNLASVNATALAANADKHIYALQGSAIQEYQMGEDGYTWSYVNTVTNG